MRRAWRDPLGWAGLLDVTPAAEDVRPLLQQRVAMLERDLATREETIAAKPAELRRVAVEIRSLVAHSQARVPARSRHRQMAALEAGLEQEIAARTSGADEFDNHLDTLQRPPPADDSRGVRLRLLVVEALARRRLWSFLASALRVVALLAGNVDDLRRGWRRGGTVESAPPPRTPKAPIPTSAYPIFRFEPGALQAWARNRLRLGRLPGGASPLPAGPRG